MEKTKYSDGELEEFREIIIKKIKDAELDLIILLDLDNNGTDDTSPTFKLLEEGRSAWAKEENGALAERQRRHIVNLENALIRIKNKTFGICRNTGKLIPKERLRIVPHATLSMEAKMANK